MCYASDERGYLVTTSQIMCIMTLCLGNITSYFKNAETQRARKRFSEELFLKHVTICKYLRIKDKSKKNGSE